MQLLKKIIFPSLACVSLLFGTACKNGKEKYTVYTNLPQGAYTLTEKNFDTVEIGGYTPNEQSFPEEDTSSYTTRGYTLYAMFTDAEIIVADDFTKEGAEEKYKQFKSDLSALLTEVSKCVSSTVKDSDIYNFNNAKAGATLEIGKTAYEVLSTAKSVYTFTEGFYNPALYYNIHAYGFSGESSHPESAEDLPDDALIAKYTDLAKRFGEVTLEEKEGRYFVTKPAYTVEADGEVISLKLDLGGVGKGYAVDKIDALYEKYGYNYGYTSFGASSMVLKSNFKTGPYTLVLTNPRSISQDAFIHIPARGEKLSTSGDNEQFYRIDGTRYCHIIDPETGKPVQKGTMSVTVIGGSAAEDDALTTAIMCMGKERAVKFIEEKLTDKKVVFTCE